MSNAAATPDQLGPSGGERARALRSAALGQLSTLGPLIALFIAAAFFTFESPRFLTGTNLSPFDAYLALRGLRTLALRVREQNRNALGLAEWLAAHPRVAQVHYSGLPASADHAVARRLFGGCFGAMLAFDLKDAGRPEVFAFMEKLQLIQRVATLGVER